MMIRFDVNSISITNGYVAKVRNFVRSNRRLTTREMVEELGFSFYALQSILTQVLNTRRVSAKLFPKLSSDEQRNTNWSA